MLSLSTPSQINPTPVYGFDFMLPEAMPFSLQQLRVDWWKTHYRQAVIELRKRETELAASKKHHEKALQREASLQQEIEMLKAKVRQREKELFSRGSEQSPSKNESNTSAKSPRSRGQTTWKSWPETKKS